MIMRSKNIVMKTLVVFFIITGFVACKPATKITGSWKNMNVSPSSLNVVLVTAITARANARQTVEDDLASALEKKGFKTIKSIDVMPPSLTDGELPDKKQLSSKIEEVGADAILTVALINKETETRHAGGNLNYVPMARFGYYGTFWGYYNNWLPAMYAPGYYSEDKVYFIETNLYDAKTQQLLWSAQSETYNPEGLKRFAKEFANVVVTKMQQDEILMTSGTQELAKEGQRDNP
jgi:hypothetical protein